MTQSLQMAEMLGAAGDSRKYVPQLIANMAQLASNDIFIPPAPKSSNDLAMLVGTLDLSNIRRFTVADVSGVGSSPIVATVNSPNNGHGRA